MNEIHTAQPVEEMNKLITYMIYLMGTFLSPRSGFVHTFMSSQHHVYKHTHTHTELFKVKLVSMNRTSYETNY